MDQEQPQQAGTVAPMVLQLVQCVTEVNQMPNGDILFMLTTPWLAIAVSYSKGQWDQVRALPKGLHIAGASDMPPPPKGL